MTFLKKLGTILANVAGIALGVGPLIKPFLGSGKAASVVSTGVNDFTAIAQVVTQIETALQGPNRGSEKLAAVIPLVANIVKTSEIVSGKKIADEAAFNKGVQGFAQGMVDVLNAIHPDEAKTENKPN